MGFDRFCFACKETTLKVAREVRDVFEVLTVMQHCKAVCLFLFHAS